MTGRSSSIILLTATLLCSIGLSQTTRQHTTGKNSPTINIGGDNFGNIFVNSRQDDDDDQLSRGKPPHPSRMAKDLWQSFQLIGRLRRPDAHEIGRLLPKFVDRFGDSKERMVEVIKANFDQMQKCAALPRRWEWEHNGTKTKDDEKRYRFVAAAKTDQVVSTWQGEVEAVVMSDGTLVTPPPEIVFDIFVDEDDEPRGFNWDCKWNFQVLGRVPPTNFPFRPWK